MSKQTKKPVLSKHTRGMKFMHRLGNAVEEEDTQKKRKIDDEHWYRDVPELSQKESCVVFQPDCVLIEEFLSGRMSFRGFNPEIEHLMRITDVEQLEKAKRQDEFSVGDLEMTERFRTLVGSRYLTKRERSKIDAEYSDQDMDDIQIEETYEPVNKQKRKEFLRPVD